MADRGAKRTAAEAFLDQNVKMKEDDDIVFSESELFQLACRAKACLAYASRGFCPALDDLLQVCAVLSDEDREIIANKLHAATQGDGRSQSGSKRFESRLHLINDMLSLPPSGSALELQERVVWTPETRKMMAFERRKLHLRDLQVMYRNKLVRERVESGEELPASWGDASVRDKETSSGVEPLVRPPLQPIGRAQAKRTFDDVLSRAYETLRSKPEDLQQIRYRTVVAQMPSHYLSLRKEWESKQARQTTLARSCKQYIDAVLLRKAALQEQAEKNRLRALKANNLEEYISLVRQTKNRRLQELLDQTDNFLKDMGARVDVQRKTGRGAAGASSSSAAAAAAGGVGESDDMMSMQEMQHEGMSSASMDDGPAAAPPAPLEHPAAPSDTDADAPMPPAPAAEDDEHAQQQQQQQHEGGEVDVDVDGAQPMDVEGDGGGGGGDDGVREQGASSSGAVGGGGLTRDVYYQLSHTIRETVTQPSILVGGTLLPYQLTGLEWMVSLYNNNLHGILADEMGLGKTVQTIALFAYLREYKSDPGPHLVVAPLSTIPNWEAEFRKWCPALGCVAFKGSKDERLQSKGVLKTGRFNVCLTTPEYVIRERATLAKQRWRHIVVDEGHRMKSAKSKFHVNMQDFESTHRLLLTGTPLQNNLTELWSLLNFLLPKIFQRADDFERWFNEPFSQLPSQEQEAALTEEEQLLIINRLHSVLRPFLLRRIKKDVLEELPDKQEYVIRVELSEWQKIVYKQIENRALRTVDSSGRVTNKSLQNHLMQLRKIVNHPYLFVEEYTLNRDLYRVSGKFEVLDRLLPKLLRFDHKVLIFCQMTRLMDILADYLEWRTIDFLRLDGGVNVDERKERMEEFNRAESNKKIFMLSTRAGGLGLNLQAADTVILFDSDFNPQQDLQAQNRAHRVGQTKEVRVYRLITLSPVEELVLLKAQHKLDIDEKIIQAGLFDTESTEKERQERLKSLFEGSEQQQEARVTTPEQLNKMLARSDEEMAYFEEYDEPLFNNAANNNTATATATAAAPPPASASGDQEHHQPWLESAAVSSLLVRSGRLMAPTELPSWVVTDLSAADIPDEPDPLQLDRTSRKARKKGVMINDNISDRQYVRIMERLADGQAGSVEEAVAQEDERRKARKRKRRRMKQMRQEQQQQAAAAAAAAGIEVGAAPTAAGDGAGGGGGGVMEHDGPEVLDEEDDDMDDIGGDGASKGDDGSNQSLDNDESDEDDKRPLMPPPPQPAHPQPQPPAPAPGASGKPGQQRRAVVCLDDQPQQMPAAPPAPASFRPAMRPVGGNGDNRNGNGGNGGNGNGNGGGGVSSAVSRPVPAAKKMPHKPSM
ncbi:unnamed protein product [Vitrella brassicaformis CCMP3155]|uniref:Uncharacterized protein n=3 Tax=Vitrella brassicaformis TaxID=1169539 RepID=A0A0G4E9Q6_VITBC|nr:unnamed protein product [Vitrella brassicaformis CCMP3155]|eukprot:CEL92169.1 unnamed protein product [Vitrella brassicaformis CCMP3155]